MKFWKLTLAFFLSLLLLLVLFIALAYLSIGGNVEELGKGYQFINEDPNSIINKDHVVKVPPRIIELGWNERFIVAVQKPNRYCIEPEERNKYPQIEKNLFYWIIDKDKDSVFGPLLYEEYKSRELTILKGHQIRLNSL